MSASGLTFGRLSFPSYVRLRGLFIRTGWPWHELLNSCPQVTRQRYPDKLMDVATILLATLGHGGTRAGRGRAEVTIAGARPATAAAANDATSRRNLQSKFMCSHQEQSTTAIVANLKAGLSA
jgi:hypothetical protein